MAGHSVQGPGQRRSPCFICVAGKMDKQDVSVPHKTDGLASNNSNLHLRIRSHNPTSCTDFLCFWSLVYSLLYTALSQWTISRFRKKSRNFDKMHLNPHFPLPSRQRPLTKHRINIESTYLCWLFVDPGYGCLSGVTAPCMKVKVATSALHITCDIKKSTSFICLYSSKHEWSTRSYNTVNASYLGHRLWLFSMWQNYVTPTSIP